MLTQGTFILLVTLAATEKPAVEAPVGCVASLQRPTTCQLELELWREGIAWATVATLGGSALLAKHYEDNSVRWQMTGGWERWLRQNLRYDEPEDRSPARRVGDTTAYLLPAAGILTASLASSVPAMLDGQWPTEALADIYTAATVFMLGSQTNQLLKVTTARRRPGVIPVDGKASSAVAVHSFPSGHAVAVFGMSTAYATTLYLRRSELWWVAAVSGGLLGGVTGVMRIVSDDHWGADVVAGALIGVGWGIAYPLLAHPRRTEEGEPSTALRLLPYPGGVALDVTF